MIYVLRLRLSRFLTRNSFHLHVLSPRENSNQCLPPHKFTRRVWWLERCNFRTKVNSLWQTQRPCEPSASVGDPLKGRLFVPTVTSSSCLVSSAALRAAGHRRLRAIVYLRLTRTGILSAQTKALVRQKSDCHTLLRNGRAEGLNFDTSPRTVTIYGRWLTLKECNRGWFWEQKLK
jgi:hypothetical protein